MITWNELRITSDGRHLTIDAQIEDSEYFLNVTIDKISIDTQDTWVENGPSSNSIVVYTQGDTPKRQVRLELQNPIINVNSNTMYFVYVTADVTKAPEYALAPCNLSNEVLIGTVVNTYYLYNSLIGGIKELSNNCNSYNNFIDSYLRLLAIEASIRTGNYPIAIKYWKLFFMNNKIKTYPKACGCYGRN